MAIDGKSVLLRIIETSCDVNCSMDGRRKASRRTIMAEETFFLLLIQNYFHSLIIL